MLDAEDVREARKRIRDEVHRTPMDPSTTFSEMAGANVHLKLENLQRTGSFKVRGATNMIMSLPDEERSRGVVAASAGNHAQGVAFAARRVGVPATIVMPERAPISKAQAVRDYGADLVLEGDDYAEAAQVARRIADERGATKIPAFDDERVMAGQGTLGLEILDDLPDVDAVVTGVGGGGLIAGIATVVKDHDPSIDVVGVQPAGASSLKPSLEAGERVTLDDVETIADGLAARSPGEETFPVIQDRVDDVAVVTDDQIARAILLLLERAKTVTEGAGAASLAAVLDADLGLQPDDDVVAVLSGGNIDVTLLDHIIRRGLSETGRSIRLTTVLEDKPGELGTLATLLADHKANIREIQHDRGRVGVGVDKAEVELTLDTRGPAHVQEVIQALEDAGYPVEID